MWVQTWITPKMSQQQSGHNNQLTPCLQCRNLRNHQVTAASGFQNPGWKIPGLRANQGQGIGKVLGKPGPRPRNLEVFHSQSIIMPRNTTALPLGDFRHISFHWMASLSAELCLHPQCWCSTELAQGTWTTNALLQTSNPNCKTPNLHACCLNHSKCLVNCIPMCPLCFLKSQC